MATEKKDLVKVIEGFGWNEFEDEAEDEDYRENDFRRRYDLLDPKRQSPRERVRYELARSKSGWSVIEYGDFPTFYGPYPTREEARTQKRLLKRTMQGVRLWVDDIRPAPGGWRWAMNYAQGLKALMRGDVYELALDYDIEPSFKGNYWSRKNGGDLAKMLVLWSKDPEKRHMVPRKIRCISINTHGRAVITKAILDIMENLQMPVEYGEGDDVTPTAKIVPKEEGDAATN